MDSSPRDVAKKLLNRDFANLVKRVQAGGKISRTERICAAEGYACPVICNPDELLPPSTP